MASLKKQAKKLAKKGRKGDKHLLHISQEELMSLMGTGGVTRNPETGLPEAYNLGHQISQAYHDRGDWAPPAAPGSAESAVNAVQANAWSHPYGEGANSMDIFAGGASSANPYARMVGRGVGSFFLGQGIGDFFGGGAAADAPSYDPSVDSSPTATGGGGDPGAGAPMYDPSVDSSPTATEDPGSSFFPGETNPAISPGGGGEGLGMPGETTTTGDSVPGDAGGDPWYRRLGRLGEYLPSLKQAGNAVQVAGGAYGLYNAYQGRQAQRAQQKQQQSYYDQLNALRANPGQVTSLPGYQFNLDQGNQALARRMASMGYGTSGNLAIATQKYGQDYATAALGNEEQLLASQYGRATAPTQQMPDPTALALRSLSQMGYGFGGG